jgi:LytS/YehU family sensor histidine kinase
MPAKSEGGIGLTNTQARLQQLYGANGRLTFNCGAVGGFKVEIEIPFREQT